MQWYFGQFDTWECGDFVAAEYWWLRTATLAETRVAISVNFYLLELSSDD